MVSLSSTCLLSALNALKVFWILSVPKSLVQSACNCRHTICSSVLQTKYVWTRHRSAGAGEEGANIVPSSTGHVSQHLLISDS